MHDLTEEDLRQIWRDLYTNVVMTSGSHIPELVHQDARKTADAYVNALRAEKKATDDAFTATLAAAPPLEWVRTAEEERRDLVAFLTRKIAAYRKNMQEMPDEPASLRDALRSQIVIMEAVLVGDIERGDHVGAAGGKDQPQAPTAELERVPVESLKEGDRVLLLGTVKDLADGSDWDAARAFVCLDGDEMGDDSTTLRAENVVYRVPAQMGDEP